MTTSFEDFPLHPALLERLAAPETPAVLTETQAQVIPAMLEGRDILVHAGPHSGETLAYGLPLLSMFDPLSKPQAVVLVPSAERAARVYKRLAPLAQGILKVAPLFEAGGAQEQLVKRGVDIVIGTPFLVKDLFAIRQLDLNAVRTLVLDGADRLMTTVQRRDVEYLLDRLPRLDQTALFFWNRTEGVEAVAHHLSNPLLVRVSVPEPEAPPVSAPVEPKAAPAPVGRPEPVAAPPAAAAEPPAPQVVPPCHRFARVGTEQRTDFLLAVIEQENPARALVIARNKHEARRLAQRLERFGRSAVESFNADTAASQRQSALRRFASGECRFLVVPDLAAKGLDFGGPGHLYLTGLATEAALYEAHAAAAPQGLQSLALVTPEAEAVFAELRKVVRFERHPQDPGPAEAEPATPAVPLAPGAEGLRPRARGGRAPKTSAAVLHNNSLREAGPATGPLAPLPRMRTTWQTFRVNLMPGQRPSRDTFHGWLAQTTGIARSSMRSIQLHAGYATVDVEERQADRFQDALKGQLG
ncbi:MAG: DEAD/DEAH box helicase [Candidatus Sericytochromatia bacterium]|nr:DEAD/DEAH box helicase [Candidatus Sericytochromatia bacterium]